MCQIFKASGVTFSFERDAVDDLFTNNPDGIGFVDFANPGTAIKVLPAGAEDAWKFISTQVNGKQGVVHFRWRTDGAVDEERVHPYPAGERFWLIHNGVLTNYRTSSFTPKNGILAGPWPSGTALPQDVAGHGVQTLQQVDPRSDTQKFAEETLGPLLDKFGTNLMLDSHFQRMLGHYIGSGNRFVIVDKVSGEHCIINEHTGTHVEDGVWQANNYAGDYRYTPIFAGYNGYGGYGHGYSGYSGYSKKKKKKNGSPFQAMGTSMYDDEGPDPVGQSDEYMPSKLNTTDDLLAWFEALGYFGEEHTDYFGTAGKQLTEIGRKNIARAAFAVYKMADPASFVHELEYIEMDIETWVENYSDADKEATEWATEALRMSLEAMLNAAMDTWEAHRKTYKVASQAKPSGKGKGKGLRSPKKDNKQQPLLLVGKTEEPTSH